jgi:hypothetical protein
MNGAKGKGLLQDVHINVQQNGSRL